MDLSDNLYCLLLAILSAIPILLVQMFVKTNIYSVSSFAELILRVIILYVSIYSLYFYFFMNNISMAVFFPVTKVIELLIPIIFSIVVYKLKLKFINYIGIFLALLSIIFVQW